MEWLVSNLGTIAVAVILICAVAWIVISLRKDKRSGKSCSCGCENCAMKGKCHK